MTTPEQEVHRLAEARTPLQGMRVMIDQGMTSTQIVDTLNLTRGGQVKRASAMRAAQRYRAAVTGSGRQARGGIKGPQDAAVQRVLRMQAAAQRLRRGGYVRWKADVTYHGRRAGTRTVTHAPFHGSDAAATALERGDYHTAGEALASALVQQYAGGAPITIDEFRELEFEF